jgi:sugar lactone lactonase YvrE
MYWTDLTAIRSANLDGTGAAKILISGLGRPTGIALDLPDGKMYWADGLAYDIERANLDGAGRQRLVATQNSTGDYVEDVALDLAAGKLYWTDFGGIGKNRGRIGRANLDGSDPQILLQGLSSPIGIALDVAGGKMYWADSHYDVQGKGDISAANLEGTGRQTILTGLNVPGRIALQLQSVP